MPLFSIVTVAYNEEKNIEKTLQSVYMQNYHDFEYIIVDGLSTDNTYEIIQRWSQKFEEKGIRCKTLSEKDQGIYDAMNKGIRFATGDWMNFMNAGDEFCSDDVLEKVAEQVDESTDIIYGDFIDEFCGLYKYIHNEESSMLMENMPFSHQSAFINKNVMKSELYDTSYRIAADYDFFLKSYMKKRVFKRTQIPIAIFSRGGASSSGNLDVIRERDKIQFSHGAINKNEYEALKLEMKRNEGKNEIKRKVKDLIPEDVLNIRLSRKYKRNGYVENLRDAIIYDK